MTSDKPVTECLWMADEMHRTMNLVKHIEEVLLEISRKRHKLQF
jgi:hypothetical protein